MVYGMIFLIFLIGNSIYLRYFFSGHVRQALAFYLRNKELERNKTLDFLHGDAESKASISLEENLPISSLQGLAVKAQRERRVSEALGFMPDTLLSLINSYDAAHDKEAQQLLKCVAQGEQIQAETMLKSKPELLLEKGTVTDLSKRTFENITAFQYALWALDWHMWVMLLKYLPQTAAAAQCKELREKGTEYGKHASWQELINAYALCGSKGTPEYWIERIGKAQLLLPAHVVNEYCDVKRAFDVSRNFKKKGELSRSRLSGGMDWYDEGCSKEWIHYRNGSPDGQVQHSNTLLIFEAIEEDQTALYLLLEARRQQLVELVKGLLKVQASFVSRPRAVQCSIS